MPVGNLPPPPVNDKPGSFTWLEWYRQLRNYVSTSGSVPWYIINFAGSNITDIALRDHNQLQGLQGGGVGEMFHLTAAEYASIISGGVPDGDKGDITVTGSGTIWNIDAATVGITELSATGTPSATTYLRGDNTWATPSGGGGLEQYQVRRLIRR